MESLDVDLVEDFEQELQNLMGDFLDDASAQSKDGLCSQSFNVSISVADFVESAFKAFSDTIHPAAQCLGVLQELIVAFGCPYLVVALFVNTKLPFSANEAFISNDLATLSPSEYCFSGLPFIQIGRNKIKYYR